MKKWLISIFLAAGSSLLVFFTSTVPKIAPKEEVKVEAERKIEQETDSTKAAISYEVKIGIDNVKNIKKEESKKESIPVAETGIVLHTENMKKQYLRNDELDLSGLIVELLYSNGKAGSLDPSVYTIGDVDMSTCGQKEITVTYNEYSESFFIDVIYFVEDKENHTKYASTSLNLRSGPGIEFEKLTTIAQNKEVTVTGVAENGWCRIIYQDKEYYCSGKYLMGEPINIVVPDPPGPYDDFITGDPGTNTDALERANYIWNEIIPDNIKQLLTDNGWKITVSGTDLSPRFGFDFKISGITLYDEKIIYIDKRKKDVNHALIHEIGHAIDIINDWPSLSDEFSEIFKTEKDDFNKCDTESIGDGHHTSSAVEYFASVFHQIFVNEEKCKEFVPRSYEFVSKYIY